MNLTPIEMGKHLRTYAVATYGSQKAAARHWGVREQFVSCICNGRKAPTPKMLDEVGMTKQITYVSRERHNA